MYEYCPDNNLKMLKFEKMTEEWLDFIASFRFERAHDYDIVEGPMADDTIFNYVHRDLLMGNIQELPFGNWQNSNILRIRSVFIQHGH